MASQIRMEVEKVRELCHNALKRVEETRQRINDERSKTWKGRWLGYDKSWAGWGAEYAAKDLLRLADYSADGFILVDEQHLEDVLS